jgi:hypothetical protein
MSQVTVTLAALDFCAGHSITFVYMFHYALLFNGLIKAGPSGAGVELGL